MMAGSGLLNASQNEKEAYSSFKQCFLLNQYLLTLYSVPRDTMPQSLRPDCPWWNVPTCDFRQPTLCNLVPGETKH